MLEQEPKGMQPLPTSETSRGLNEDPNLIERTTAFLKDLNKLTYFESVKALRDGLESEKRAMERIWKHRESQITRLDRSASQMFGEFQGVVPSLKPIKNLELTTGEEDETEQETLI